MGLPGSSAGKESACKAGFPVWFLGYSWVIFWFLGVWLFVTLWTVALRTPLFMGFPRQEYWSGLSCPFPWVLPDPGIKPASLISPPLVGGFFTTNHLGSPNMMYYPEQINLKSKPLKLTSFMKLVYFSLKKGTDPHGSPALCGHQDSLNPSKRWSCLPLNPWSPLHLVNWW